MICIYFVYRYIPFFFMKTQGDGLAPCAECCDYWHPSSPLVMRIWSCDRWCKAPKVPASVYAHPYPYKLRICRIFKLNRAWRRNIHFIPNRYNHHLPSWNTKRSEKNYPNSNPSWKISFCHLCRLIPLNKNLPKSPPIAPLHGHWSPRIWFPKIQVHGLSDVDIAKRGCGTPWYSMKMR